MSDINAIWMENYYNLFREIKDKGMVEYALNGDGSTVRFDSIFNQAFGVSGFYNPAHLLVPLHRIRKDTQSIAYLNGKVNKGITFGGNQIAVPDNPGLHIVRPGKGILALQRADFCR